MSVADFKPGEGGGWTNIGQMHTVPEDEIHLHALAPGCACGPKVKMEDRVLIYVHNSYDAREFNEKVKTLRPVEG